MRLLILRIGCWVVLAGAVRAQSSTSDTTSVTQLPVGQVYRNFEFPHYEDGQLKYTLAAAEARGITINRAETTDLKIDLYESGKVTTTITSPKADIYVSDRKMRTRNSVQIERADLEATGQICDFDLITKQYLLRTNVKVILKNFDANASLGGKPAVVPGQAAPKGPAATPTPVPAPAGLKTTPAATGKDDTLLESPGSFSSTNSAPASP